ncbi:MAG: hypothetical protein UHG68_01250 [Clostridia bacterium]|nr:hypothetical protein [Clostridia bacterium]
MMLKEMIALARKGTEINAYYTNTDGERVAVYTDLDGKAPAFVRNADVYGIGVSDNGVLMVEVEEP